VIVIISYEPLYKTLKEKNISTYKLIKQYNISRSLLDRLKHDKPISTVTLNDLCTILDCKVEDVLVFKKDNKKEKGV
jgi:putative transcriptional regulator